MNNSPKIIMFTIEKNHITSNQYIKFNRFYTYIYRYISHLESKVAIQEKTLRVLLDKYKEQLEIYKRKKKTQKNKKGKKILDDEIISPELKKVNLEIFEFWFYRSF